MLLIPDNTTLRSFIPNTFATQPGERSLFDKITPFLQSAEIWFRSEFIPEEILQEIIDSAQTQEDPLYFLPRRIVALRAWQTAIPSLDVVISPNGVGVAETNTLKPASKAKIDNLQISVAAELDRNIEQLLPVLPTIPGWITSPQADKFSATLFPTFEILHRLGLSDNLWNRWLGIIRQITSIEDEIGEKWISTPLLHRIRRINLQPTPDNAQRTTDNAQRTIRQLISRVKSAVTIILSSDSGQRIADNGQRITPYLEEANALIRNNPEIFPEWPDSTTARFFATPAFRNRPGSTAFYF